MLCEVQQVQFLYVFIYPKALRLKPMFAVRSVFLYKDDVFKFWLLSLYLYKFSNQNCQDCLNQFYLKKKVINIISPYRLISCIPAIEPRCPIDFVTFFCILDQFFDRLRSRQALDSSLKELISKTELFILLRVFLYYDW